MHCGVMHTGISVDNRKKESTIFELCNSYQQYSFHSIIQKRESAHPNDLFFISTTVKNKNDPKQIQDAAAIWLANPHLAMMKCLCMPLQVNHPRSVQTGLSSRQYAVIAGKRSGS